ncbi:sigma-70 family RNA polymerase sigma factor [Lysinibacter cavernae]|uniref:RNA polymerase sigma factor (Sigma-70 family) n=1 Tax=Lysinibacter cavernae TaxID=1640652 RepID=A0A7X5R2R2_9MICO|nr:sigma-70 family RNA polymerase sigma factor [Lysinibacter cavernae]NIH54526.1 RNA polymerase sigma factor (sigma-70 family) [Lysinibacter cavernae]
MQNNTPAIGDRENEFIVRFTERMDALLRYARGVARDRYLGEDLLSEAFIATLSAVRRGKGPSQETFDAYMLRAIRNIATRHAKNQGRVIQIAEPAELEEKLAPHYSPETAVDTWNVANIRTAFLALPARDRQVLYLTEVEQLPHTEIAENLGLRANTVTVIAHRAKANLRARYLEQTANEQPGCGTIDAAKLAAHVAGTLSAKRNAVVIEHLEACDDCAATVRRLRSFRVPVAIMVGLAAANADATAGVVARTTGNAASSARTPVSVLSKIGYPASIAAAALIGFAVFASIATSSAGPTDAGTGTTHARQAAPTPANVAVGAGQGATDHRCYAPAELLQRAGSMPQLEWDKAEAGASMTWPLLVSNVAPNNRASYSLTLTPAPGTQIDARQGDCAQAGSNLVCVIDGAVLHDDSFTLPVAVTAAAGVEPRPPTILYSPTAD